MKVLWLTEFFPASGAGEITGGVEARCFFVRRELERREHEITVIAERTTGRRWAHLSFGSLPKQLWFIFRLLFKTVSRLPETYDLVEGTNYSTYFLAWAYGKLKNIPVVFWYPDVFLGEWQGNIGLIGIIGEIGERLILRLPVAAYIAISETTKEKLVKAGVAAEKITVVYCGVDGEEIKTVKSGRVEERYDLCSVNRLVAYKRVSDQVNAIARLWSKFPGLTAAIVGQGPEKNNLSRQAEKLGVRKSISFLGYMPRYRDVLRTIRSSKIFCLSSGTEGFGIVLIETAALGVPYVAADIPVIREITKGGQGGLLFRMGDPEDLARKAEMLLTDGKLYRQKSREGIKLAGRYSWRAIAEATEKVYELVL